MPGHIFPLIAKEGGVLTRAGHTEAGCDLARIAGYTPSSAIVEVMNEDGTMAKRSELEAFANHHNIKIGTIADLIQYRTLYDKTIELKDTQRIKTAAGWFDLKTYTDKVSDCVHFALIKGQIDESKPCLVRVQVLNTLRDIFLAERPDKKPSWSLLESMEKIVRSGTGAVVIVGQEPSQEELLSQIRYFPEIPPTQRQSN